MTSELKPVPNFASEHEERTYWETHDSTQHIDWSKAEKMMLPNLKLSSTAISLRSPQPS